MSLSILAASTTVYQAGMVVLLVLGFGFVIFWHELGHFLAAKWVGIRVEQFAVGFGQAVFSWRKGIGFRAGNTQKAYRDKIEAYLAQKDNSTLQFKEKPGHSDQQMTEAADELGLGETEYRLNWIPLGGYVKMLGQDDLRPDAAAEDPRAYNRKSVSARMLVISAGVIMNVILAAIMFVVVFLIGLHAQPAKVGVLVAQSPAQAAGIMVGDTILTLNGNEQQDFTKITLDVALAKADTAVPVTVLRTVDGVAKRIELQITPRKSDAGRGFVGTGIGPPPSLRGIKKEEVDEVETAKSGKAGIDYSADAVLVLPGDVIKAVNGQPVTEDDYPILDRAAQHFGAPVELTLAGPDGAMRKGVFQPHLSSFFNGLFNLAGMQPRATISMVSANSSARGRLQAGDAIASVVLQNGQTLNNPANDKLMDTLKAAGSSGEAFTLTIVRGDQVQTVSDLRATADVGERRGQKGLGVGLAFDEQHLVLGDVVADSPAAHVGLAAGDEITAVNDQPVRTWYDLHRTLAAASAESELHLAYVRGGKAQQASLKLDAAHLQTVQNVRYEYNLALDQATIVRKAKGPVQAVKWGVIETRDFILQFYVTLQRMFEGSVALSNMMGPVGIFRGGVKFAFRGMDWLLWFLAMISANLAVVNFLPIPVVDGGQFVFLMLEKIKGRPLSPKAMAIAQYAGLAFLAAVVVFVTYHDIMRRSL